MDNEEMVTKTDFEELKDLINESSINPDYVGERIAKIVAKKLNSSNTSKLNSEDVEKIIKLVKEEYDRQLLDVVVPKMADRLKQIFAEGEEAEKKKEVIEKPTPIVIKNQPEEKKEKNKGLFGITYDEEISEGQPTLEEVLTEQPKKTSFLGI